MPSWQEREALHTADSLLPLGPDGTLLRLLIKGFLLWSNETWPCLALIQHEISHQAVLYEYCADVHIHYKLFSFLGLSFVIFKDNKEGGGEGPS